MTQKIPLKAWAYLICTLLILINAILFLFFESKPFLAFLLLLSIILSIHLTLKEWRDKKKSKMAKMLHYFFYVGLILGLALSLFLLILIQKPQANCERVDEEKIKGVDQMIILGAGLKEGEIEADLKDRLDVALKVIQKAGKLPQARSQESKAMTIIVTGGVNPREVISEAEAMGAYLIAQGMPKEWIIYEKKSTSTFENFKFGREKADERVGEIPQSRPTEVSNNKILVITSDFHVFRASMIAKHFGFEAIPICSQMPLGPKIGATLREIAALAKDALKIELSKPVEPIMVNKPNPQEYLYFHDEVILSGKDAQQKPFLLVMYANRKKDQSEEWIHFYNAKLFYKGKLYEKGLDFSSPEQAVQKEDFFKHFNNQIAPDLSTRESYDFEMEIEGQNLKVELMGLQGDFISKNTYDYTRYSSAGQAKIQLNGEELKANAVLEKAYSGDYRKYVYFDGFDDFKGVTHVFIVWDEEGNLYSIDQTQVLSKHQGYTSHQWALYKNRSTGGSQKAFSFNISLEKDQWKVTVPDLGFELVLNVPDAVEWQADEGLVEGVVRGDFGEQKVQGFFIYDR